jgi:two-component system OmpR family sensor kinase
MVCRYGFAVAAVVGALVLRQLLLPLTGEEGQYMFILTAVAIASWYGGFRPGVVVATLATLASACARLLQVGLPYAIAPGELVALGGLLAEGLILSALVGTLHARCERAEDALHVRDALLAAATRELKAPLVTIIGYTQTLQLRAAHQGQLSRGDQDILRVVAAQGKRLHGLIESLLDLARPQGRQLQITPQVIDLSALAQRVLDVVRLTATHHIVEHIDPDVPLLIRSDPLRLEQVLEHLLQNAITHCPVDEQIAVTVERRGNQAALSVSGQGIDATAHASLSARHDQASGVNPHHVPDNSIGLAIVHDIVARHGGMVEVDRAEGQGRRITVRLPLAEALPTG